MQHSNAHASERPAPLHPLRVLVVEDNDDLRAVLSGVLRDDGYAVTEARDGACGFEVLRSSPIDIVLLDLWLPGMDGWSFRAEQLSEAVLRDIPVVVMTADGRPEARAIHADAILRKPFEIDALSTTIRRVLASRSAQVEATTRGVSDVVSLLASAVGHEVANPLMTLIHGLQTSRAEERHSSDASDPSVDDLLSECSRIANCLSVLRTLPCPSPTHEDEVDLCDAFRWELGRAETAGTRIAFEADGAAWVRGDPVVLRYLCRAVLSNAIEAVSGPFTPGRGSTRDGPDVVVQISCSEFEVTLDVHDFGAAIPDGELDRVFAPGSPGRGRAWGAGVRLSFVRKIATMLGGLVEISNVPGGGVLCRVRLPASPTRARPPITPEA